MLVTNGKKALMAALANQPSTSSLVVSTANWTAATNRVTKTGLFTQYKNEFSDTDYFLVQSGVGISTVGSIIKITGVDSSGNYITLETDIHGSDVTGSISGVIFKANPRFHNLYLALGTGSSSWDYETPIPSKSATQLKSEFFRKRITRVVHMREYEGVTSSATAGPPDTIVSADFAQFGTNAIGQLIEIIDGLGVKQVRQITAFDSASNEFEITPAWTTVPDTTSKWRVAIPQFEPTGIVDIITEITSSDGGADGVIREMALFGGDATATFGSGQMINLIHHAAITKTSGNSLTRIIRLRLELS